VHWELTMIAGVMKAHLQTARSAKPASVWLTGTACCAMFAATLACDWPGNVSADGTIQWYEARFSDISHGHPAFLSFVWHWLDLLDPSPGPVLALELALLWGAAFVVFVRLRSTQLLLLVGCAFIACFPFLTAYQAVVIKDVMAGNAAILGYCLLLHLPSRRPKLLIAAAFVAFGLAGLFRYQLWLVALPAMAGIAVLSPWREALARIAIGFGMLCLTVLAGNAAMQATLVFERTAPGIVLEQAMLYDIAAVLVHEPAASLDVFAQAGVDTDTFTRRSRILYSTQMLDFLTRSGRDGTPSVEGLLTGVGIEVVQRQWQAFLLRYPLDFARHRVQTFARLMGVGDIYDCSPLVTVGFTRSPAELWQALHPIGLQEAMSTALLRWRYFPLGTPIFRPVSYLLVSFVLAATIIASRSASAIIPLCMLGGAWLYWLSYVPMPVACDIRYSYFSCAAVLFVAVYWVGLLLPRTMPYRSA
jgi:hypothetical protein